MPLFKINIIDRAKPVMINGKCFGYENYMLEIEADTAQNACQQVLEDGYEVLWNNPIIHPAPPSLN